MKLLFTLKKPPAIIQEAFYDFKIKIILSKAHLLPSPLPAVWP